MKRRKHKWFTQECFCFLFTQEKVGDFSKRLSWKTDSSLLVPHDSDMEKCQSIYRLRARVGKELICLPHCLTVCWSACLFCLSFL